MTLFPHLPPLFYQLIFISSVFLKIHRVNMALSSNSLGTHLVHFLVVFKPASGFPGVPSGKEPACQHRRHETQVLSWGWEDLLEKERATHSSVLAWEIPWTEEPGRLQSMGSHRVRHDWSNLAHTQTCQIYKNLINAWWLSNWKHNTIIFHLSPKTLK